MHILEKHPSKAKMLIRNFYLMVVFDFSYYFMVKPQ